MPIISCYFYYSNHACRAVWFLFLCFFFSFSYSSALSNKCNTGFIPKESLPAVPAAQLWLISAESELELSFLCLSSPLVLCAAPPHSLCVNQVKDNDVLCLVGQLSSISTSFLVWLIYPQTCFSHLSVAPCLEAHPVWHWGIWPSPGLPKPSCLQCPCYKTVFQFCLCRQTMPTQEFSALALRSSLQFPDPHICAGSVTSLQGKDVVASC